MIFLLIFGLLNLNAWQQGPPGNAYVVLLGSGTPFADPNKSGPAYAVVVNDETYLVDCGPGIVRRSAEAFASGLQELEIKNLNKVFITHLHSDHTIGLADLFLTPAVLGRSGPLNVFGPRGTSAMADGVINAYAEDIAMRTQGPEAVSLNSFRMIVKENREGMVYHDSNVTVTAFKVSHGSWHEAYGYRFDLTSGQRIVFSGDCTYTPEVANQCNGCSLLFHEVYSTAALEKRPEHWRNYHSQFHTSTTQLADLATLAKPQLLVLTHQLTWGMGDEQVKNEMSKLYLGEFISGSDLDVFTIPVSRKQ